MNTARAPFQRRPWPPGGSGRGARGLAASVENCWVHEKQRRGHDRIPLRLAGQRTLSRVEADFLFLVSRGQSCPLRRGRDVAGRPLSSLARRWAPPPDSAGGVSVALAADAVAPFIWHRLATRPRSRAPAGDRLLPRRLPGCSLSRMTQSVQMSSQVPDVFAVYRGWGGGARPPTEATLCSRASEERPGEGPCQFGTQALPFQAHLGSFGHRHNTLCHLP